MDVRFSLIIVAFFRNYSVRFAGAPPDDLTLPPLFTITISY